MSGPNSGARNHIQTGRPGNLRLRDETAAAQGPLAQLSEDQLLKFAQDVTGRSFGGEKSVDFAQPESTSRDQLKTLSDEVTARLKRVCEKLAKEDIPADEERRLAKIFDQLRDLRDDLDGKPRKQAKVADVVRTGALPSSNFLLDLVDPMIASKFKVMLNASDFQLALLKDPSCLLGKYAGIAGKIGKDTGGIGMLIAELPEGPMVGIELRMRKKPGGWKSSHECDPGSNFTVTITAAPLMEASNSLVAIGQTFVPHSTASPNPMSLNIPGTSGRYSFMPAPFGSLIVNEIKPDFPDPTQPYKNLPSRPWTIEFLAKMYGGATFEDAFRAYFVQEREGGQSLAHAALLELVDSGDLQKLIEMGRVEGNTGLSWMQLSTSIGSINAGFRGSSRGRP